jgi:hypothetical protein
MRGNGDLFGALVLVALELRPWRRCAWTLVTRMGFCSTGRGAGADTAQLAASKAAVQHTSVRPRASHELLG